MGEKCSKVSENHIQKIDGHVSFPAVWATGTRQGEALEPGLGRKGSPVHTRHDLRRSETHGCKYMGENGSKISEDHIQKIEGNVSSPAVWATGTRQGKALDDGKDPPCIRDTIRDVQRHMGASTWVKSVQKSVKITSRQRWTHVISGRLGDGDSTRRGPGAWSWTERIPRAYETRSETFRDTWVQVHG